MANDVTVLVADPPRVAALRDEFHPPGRVLRFSSSNLPSVLESIRAHQPAAVVLDALFAQSAEGQAFVHRVEQLAVPESAIQLVALTGGKWTVTPMSARPAGAEPPPPALNTRRTPRFAVVDQLQAIVDGNMTNLVDVSVLGAQVVSTPRLTPNQRIKITLPDGTRELKLAAHVAWSMFEKPKATIDAYYRAGMEFSEAAAQTLDEYCKRHCRTVDS